MISLKMLVLASAALAAPALAQSVEIKTSPNGQLSGSATAGDISTSVDTGRTAHVRTSEERESDRVVTSSVPCTPGTRSRSVRVVSPDGSSASSVSVSGGGTVSAAGGGSPGSRVYDEGCPEGSTVYRSTVQPRQVAVQTTARPTVAVQSATAARRAAPARRNVVHRRVVQHRVHKR